MSNEHEEGDADLVTILTTDQRKDLVLLVTAATEEMRSWLTRSFDNAPSKRDKDSDDEKEDKEDFVNATAGSNPETPNFNIKLKDLRHKVLTSFDEWQQKVLARVAEVVNSREAHEKGGLDAHKQVVEEEDEVKPEPGERDNEVYPAVPTTLRDSLSPSAKPLILHSLLLLLLSLKHYDARSRSLLRLIATSLNVRHTVLVEQEKVVAMSLVKAARGMHAEEEKKKKAEEGRWGNRIKIGLAGVAGAAVIGITGGLAAPLVAAGIGGVMSGIGLGATAAATYLGALASSGALVGALFGAYGGKMTGEMMESYAKEIEDFAFIPVKPLKEENRLSVTIAISGWLTASEEVYEPWRCLSDTSEVYALRWETKALLNLGNALQSMLKGYAFGYIKAEIIKRTILGALWSALWPLGLLKIARVVDNPFSVAKNRAEKAGAVLADALINKAQGERPVTLIGYSLGSRVIYSCLLALAERGATGLIENVYMLGTPAPTSSEDWAAMRGVVSGRLVNVYSTNDYILAFLYRTSAVQLGVAGLQEVDWPEHIENFDYSKSVEGHLRYRFLVGSILARIAGSELVDIEVVKEDLRLAEEQKLEEERLEAEAKSREDDHPEKVDDDLEEISREIDDKISDRETLRDDKEIIHGMDNVKLSS